MKSKQIFGRRFITLTGGNLKICLWLLNRLEEFLPTLWNLFRIRKTWNVNVAWKAFVENRSQLAAEIPCCHIIYLHWNTSSENKRGNCFSKWFLERSKFSTLAINFDWFVIIHYWSFWNFWSESRCLNIC